MKISNNPKPINSNLFQACCKSFDRYITEGTIFSQDSTFYDILTRYDYFTISPKEKGVYFNRARFLLQEKENSKKVGKVRPNLYINSTGLIVVFKSKVLALEQYFKIIKEQNKHLNQVLKPITKDAEK